MAKQKATHIIVHNLNKLRWVCNQALTSNVIGITQGNIDTSNVIGFTQGNIDLLKEHDIDYTVVIKIRRGEYRDVSSQYK